MFFQHFLQKPIAFPTIDAGKRELGSVKDICSEGGGGAIRGLPSEVLEKTSVTFRCHSGRHRVGRLPHSPGNAGIRCCGPGIHRPGSWVVSVCPCFCSPSYFFIRLFLHLTETSTLGRSLVARICGEKQSHPPPGGRLKLPSPCPGIRTCREMFSCLPLLCEVCVCLKGLVRLKGSPRAIGTHRHGLSPVSYADLFRFSWVTGFPVTHKYNVRPESGCVLGAHRRDSSWPNISNSIINMNAD